ncbi:glycogen debranching N-terminal domain-containing protein [Haloferax sp. YSMS24]|uniref:glycogen debranching N-terminal domain-containing protein n=1 Tax=Haloferax sp. YSMS24 TaxID=3388425 RepID=UPI00398D2B02
MLPENCMLALHGGRQVVVDEHGDVSPENDHCGIYSDDHRYLRGVDLRVDDASGEVRWERLGRASDGDAVTTVLTSSTDGPARGDTRAWTLTKQFSIDRDGVTVTFGIQNNTNETRGCELEVTIDPGFEHIFEVESFFSARDARDRPVTATRLDEGTVRYTAKGVDETERSVSIETNRDDTDDANESVQVESDETAVVSATQTVGPATTESLSFTISLPGDAIDVPSVDVAPADIDPRHRSLASAASEALDALLLPEGVPAAGAPRFVAPFGRDSLIVGYQLLAFDASVAERTLRFLASEQGTDAISDTLEEPGKILHEHRTGDLTEAGISLRRPYYGNIDATALFVALYADAVEAQVSDSLEDDLYESATAAVEWILDTADEDGFLRYDAHDHPYGLNHLGWKDSSEALAHPDGREPTGRIALSEVQGYSYRALRAFEPIAREHGDEELADACGELADRLFDSFEAQFWVPSEGCYALALDGSERIPSVATNQTHAFWGGLGTDERVESAVDRLLEPDVLTSSGLRTFAGDHEAFDPLSYHRGSVWPHDNSLAALGFAERGFDHAAELVAERSLDALGDSLTRAQPNRFGFPELFTGLNETVPNGYLVHPDSCEPAAWAAGSVFGFLTAHPEVRLGDNRMS